MPRPESMASSTSSGFTLIEVLVALAIAGLGLALLFAATGAGLESSTAAARHIQAAGQAQSRLAQVGLTLPLKKGEYFGDEIGGFHWRVHIGDAISHTSAGTGAAAMLLYPVTVTESWREGAEQKRLSLYSERVGRQ
jgi:prepilin-type N-terminal cleavage/methylation domain-containing protein